MELLQISSRIELINYLLGKGLLLSPELVNRFDEPSLFVELKEYILHAEKESRLFTEEDITTHFLQRSPLTTIISAQQSNSSTASQSATPSTTIHPANSNTSSDSLFNKDDSSQTHHHAKLNLQTNVKVIYTYRDFVKKREIEDFVKYFNNKYRALAAILQKRDLPALSSINKLFSSHSRPAQASSKTAAPLSSAPLSSSTHSFSPSSSRPLVKEDLSIIGMVYSITTTKNGHIVLDLEDPTGKIRVLINKNRDEIFTLAKEIVLDEVVAVTGVLGEGIFFANKIFFPDVPTNKELKRAPDEVYAAFISDLQIGSKRFMHDDFLRFIAWMNGKIGTDEQRRIAQRTKYLFMVGDIVDGIGVYPSQYEELAITDIYEQYHRAAEYFRMFPPDVHIIMIPGNHDALRLADPQPPILRRYAPELWELKNVTHVSSPGIVRIHQSKQFPGFDVLLYHGFSVFHYADVVEKLRNAGGGDRADLVLKFLLQKRHLAPSHGSNLYIPDVRGDPLVIESVPDFFVCGHVHRANAINYRNVTIMSCSCWDGISDYSRKFGGNPLPGRVPIVNLQTRSVKIMKFVQDEAEP